MAARLQGEATSMGRAAVDQRRQAGLLLAGKACVVRGVAVAFLYGNMPCLFLRCLGTGPAPERASEGIGKISQDRLCNSRSLLLLLPDLLLHSSRKDAFALPREDQAVSILGGEEDRDGSRTEPWGPACSFLG